ncbi:MAG: hypothetical protein HW416_841 [Chloroflexi bacterium]|nr:hypothetical protein [Chloroflexota bacterium]
MIQRLITMTVLMTMLLQASLLAPTTASAQCTFAPGTPVQLAGTPHLFIVDDDGMLHWGGDTRALAGRLINWDNQCSMALTQLLGVRRGDPWLSSGLPKIGDPIYLAKWEDSAAAPTLLHIQSIADVELFGINTNNYGNFVLDRLAWEQRYAFRVGLLRVGPLASAGSFAWSETDRASYGRLLPSLESAESAALVSAVSTGTDASTALAAITACEGSSLATFESGRNDEAALQGARDCLSRSAPADSQLAQQPQTQQTQQTPSRPLASASNSSVVRIEVPTINSTASGQRQFSGFAVDCATGAAALQVRIFRGTTSAGPLLATGSVGTAQKDLNQACSGSGLTGSQSIGWTATLDTKGLPDGYQIFTAVADFPGGGTARDSLPITLANNTALFNAGGVGVGGCQMGYVATTTYGCQPGASTGYGASSMCSPGFAYNPLGCQTVNSGGAGNCQGILYTGSYTCQAGGYPGSGSGVCQAGSVSTSAYGCLPVGSTPCASGMVSTSLGCLAPGTTGATGSCPVGQYYLQSYGCVRS